MGGPGHPRMALVCDWPRTDEAAGGGVAVDHDGTVPEVHEEGEGQRHNRDGEVDQPQSIEVAEVDGSQFTEVGDEGHFGEDGEATDPKHHANKLEDVRPGDSQQQDGMDWEGRKVR